MLFSVGIYNKFVRNATRSGNKYTGPVNPAFADVQYYEMEAASLLDVEKSVARSYPARSGFVLDFVKTIKIETE